MCPLKLPLSIRLVFACVLFLLVSGCGGDAAMDVQMARMPTSKDAMLVGQPDPVADGTASGGDAATSQRIQRRIVYDASLTLIVDDYATFEDAITKLADTHDGFIAKSETSRRYENRQSGTWVVRIPVDNYTVFLEAIGRLGFAESRAENAQDITAEYVDVESRIRNNQQLEQRVLELLQDRTGKLADVLEIERELARVRDEIERMQGRLRLLRDQSSLATITLKVREEKAYVPSDAPTLGGRMATAWRQSLGLLRQAGEGCVIAAVAVLPWGVVLSLAASLLFLIARWLFRRRRVGR